MVELAHEAHFAKDLCERVRVQLRLVYYLYGEIASSERVVRQLHSRQVALPDRLHEAILPYRCAVLVLSITYMHINYLFTPHSMGAARNNQQIRIRVYKQYLKL